ncbi:hypothetical protein BDQ12DRAFT_618900, partial [Crucibulum laeve]
PIAQCSEFDKCATSLDGRKTLRKILPNGLPDNFASPGCFSTNLSNSIHVKLTSAQRTALHRYTFPAGITHPRIAVDITDDGQRSSTNPVMTLDPDTAEVKGCASFASSFGPGEFEFCFDDEIVLIVSGLVRSYSTVTCVNFKGEGKAL